jgi:hypothetical protein
MKKFIHLGISIIMLAYITVLPMAWAADTDIMDNTKKAMEMFNRSIALIESEGLIRALYEFNTRKEYLDGAIHMMVVTEDGVLFANSIDPELIGVNLSTVKSENPKTGEIYSFQDALADMEKAGDETTQIKWKWINPVTNEVQQKVAFTKRIYDPKANYRVIFYVGAAYFVPLDE